MGNCVLYPADQRRRDSIGRAAAAFVGAVPRAWHSVAAKTGRPALPKLVLIIRHGEKPTEEGDLHLAPKGYQRAGALAALFDAKHNGGAYPAIDALFAAGNSKESHRPVATLKPLARQLDLAIDESHGEKDYARLAAALLGKSHDGKAVLICWRHGQIPALAEALKATGPPAKWPDDRFDLIWRLDYDAVGAPKFRLLPQLLLHGDKPAD